MGDRGEPGEDGEPGNRALRALGGPLDFQGLQGSLADVGFLGLRGRLGL